MERIKSGMLKYAAKFSFNACLLIFISVFLFSCSSPSFYVQKEPAKGVYHRVKKGETLWSIARAYSTKTQDLAEVNNIDNPDLIEDGAVIFIPDANQVIDDVMTSVKFRGTDARNSTGADDVTLSGNLSGSANHKATQEEGRNLEKKTLPPATPKPDKAKLAKIPSREDALSSESDHEVKHPGEKTEEKDEVQLDRRRFVWPVRGSVKTRFGIQPNKTYHNWIKIVSTAGTQVRSAATGTVIFSSPLPQFGETIIIRHADGFATVYAHLKKRYVKSDQNVKKGDAIALLGETDEAGDVYMNFEVRLNKKPRNPLFFLP